MRKDWTSEIKISSRSERLSVELSPDVSTLSSSARSFPALPLYERTGKNEGGGAPNSASLGNENTADTHARAQITVTDSTSL